jgi:hypothetical protein
MWQEMAETKLKERRKSLRFQVKWEAIIKGKNSTRGSFNDVGVVVNLSSRGAFLHLDNRIEVGTKLEVWIKLPNEGERWLMYTGKVIRCEDSRQTNGIAMQFLKARPWFVDDSQQISYDYNNPT